MTVSHNNDDTHSKIPENSTSFSETPENRNKDMKNSSPYVVRRFPYWVAPPERHQTFRDIEWGVMEVLSDKTLRFVREQPDQAELDKLIEHLESQY